MQVVDSEGQSNCTGLDGFYCFSIKRNGQVGHKEVHEKARDAVGSA